MSDRVPDASVALVTERARALVARGSTRVLVLRARPRWPGADHLDIAGARVLVRPAVSQLAALDALAARGPQEYLIVLTDREDADLGDAVLLATERHRAEAVDEWSAVPGLYDAQHIDPALGRTGSWVPRALLENQPAVGWPAAPAGVVTADHALGNLLGAVLRQPLPMALDLVTLIGALDSEDGRAGWHAAPETLRAGLIGWAASSIGPAAAMASSAAARGPVAVLALGLALDVLWPESQTDPVDAEQGPARGRVERKIDGKPVHPQAARALAAASRSLLLRMDALGDPAVPGLLAQAEALLGDIGWPTGADRSTVLPQGLTARLHALMDQLDVSDLAATQDRLPAVEGALGDLVAHDLAGRHEPQVQAARMAVRLVRWVVARRIDIDPAPADLGGALRDYVHDGAWVDRAAAVVWNGSTDQVVSAAYRGILDVVRQQRAELDRTAAQLLAGATGQNAPIPGVTLVEDVLRGLVAPLATELRPLVIVLDGMSVPVATELADALTPSWSELVPTSDAQRIAVLAALPTLTRYSRTALFTGELRDGNQDVEKAAMRERFGAPVFHKDDLRAPAGEALPEAVRTAIDDRARPIVAVVLNTIDDALARHDPGGMRWDLDTIQHLRTLLDAAAMAGRAVVLTSDHGHVVERGSTVTTYPGAQTRWRPVPSGPPTSDEILVRGPRVVTGDAVLPWREDLRYASLRSGYHGGASLAEITIPFLLLTRAGATPSGWTQAPPQAPAWWIESLRDGSPATTGRRARRGAGDRVVTTDLQWGAPTAAPAPAAAGDSPQGVLPLDLPPALAPRPAPGTTLVDMVAASETYAGQRRRAGRHALAHGQVATVLSVLLERDGRAHRDTLAASLGVPTTAFPSVLAALGRLLNVDGYAVIAVDADGVTVRLDEALLREQFELGPRRG